MYICIYVYVYIYICVYMYICIYVNRVCTMFLHLPHPRSDQSLWSCESQEQLLQRLVMGKCLSTISKTMGVIYWGDLDIFSSVYILFFYIYIYRYIYIYIYVYIYIYTHTCMRTYTCIHTYAYYRIIIVVNIRM